MTPSLTESERRVLDLLKQPRSCTEVGEALWGGRFHRQVYARPAGRVIQKLIRLGHAKRVFPPGWEKVAARYAIASWSDRCSEVPSC